MARPARFERATSAFGGQHSIQLSYGRKYLFVTLGFSRIVQKQFFRALSGLFPANINS